MRLIVIWIILYTIGHVFVLKDINIVTGLKSIAHGLTGGYYYYNHLWYLYVTICLYLLTPLLQLVIKEEKNTNYILIIWVVYGVIIPIVSHYIKVLEPSAYFNMNYLGGYLGYYILGYKIGNIDIKKRKWNLLFVLIWILTSGICILNMKYNNGDTYWQDFMSPGIILMSVVLFLAVKQNSLELTKDYSCISLLERIAGISLGVYLLHFFMRDLFMKVYWEYIKTEWLYMMFEPLAVGITTILIVALLSRIKFLKKILFLI